LTSRGVKKEALNMKGFFGIKNYQETELTMASGEGKGGDRKCMRRD